MTFKFCFESKDLKNYGVYSNMKREGFEETCLRILGTSPFHLTFHSYKAAEKREDCVVIVKEKHGFDQNCLVIYTNMVSVLRVSKSEDIYISIVL